MKNYQLITQRGRHLPPWRLLVPTTRVAALQAAQLPAEMNASDNASLDAHTRYVAEMRLA